ncbi:hypothetical protein DEJ16_00615 [Curtobacterium sp. MCJR17_055]|uniref:hypothetical protein n=1 Tax=unclassified Curtobacterium TaxID=257496 RepID=UPI000D85382A|nr:MULTISPECIES: hypothetical protein [unclassified Curtobacterium]PYY34584.1 hypothetical protein DEI87_09285 [Curtobacterium sp. MCBD17_029]PYY57600.1 hypothetical protein DEJ26_11805 [Curtobacterium sp. MCPF17_015]PYY58258.1 hypothetical protein DEJ16_00615 [Curtobacterium sp. MCJR17_055]WIB36851.1 hypothetical protein DEJ15_07605 [Curtobacterium sp. MCJR17_043]
MTDEQPTAGRGPVPGHDQPGPGWGAVPPPGSHVGPPPAAPVRAAVVPPGASPLATTGAALTVVSVVLVEFVAGLVGLVGTSTIVGPFRSHGGTSLVEAFVQSVFVTRFPFHLAAFLVLAFLVPVVPRAPLPVVLLRVLLAGAGGTLALALVGLVHGMAEAAGQGTVGQALGRLLVDSVTTPVQIGLPLALMLLGSSTVAWLWLGRARRRPEGAPRA